MGILTVILMLKVSQLNYPGGEALMKLHTLEHERQSATVYIDNYAAQTGVSRFGQLHDTSSESGSKHWIYDKTENFTIEDLLNQSKFTYMLVENKDVTKTLVQKSIGHETVASVEAFAGYKLSYKEWKWPIKIERKDAILVLKQNY